MTPEPEYIYRKGEGWVCVTELWPEVQYTTPNVREPRAFERLVKLTRLDMQWDRAAFREVSTPLCDVGTCNQCDTTFTAAYNRLKRDFPAASTDEVRLELCARFWSTL